MSYFAKAHKKRNAITGRLSGVSIRIDIDKVIYAAENGFIPGFRVHDPEKFADYLVNNLLEIDYIEQYEEGETAFEGLFNALFTKMCEDGVDYISYYPD